MNSALTDLECAGPYTSSFVPLLSPFPAFLFFLTEQSTEASISIHTGLDVCIEAELTKTDLQ